MKGIVFFDPADKIYRDHFPGKPTVPGSLIVHAFLRIAQQHGFCVGNVKNFRFLKFVAPGEYSYELEKKEGKLKCRLLHVDETLASGVLEI